MNIDYVILSSDQNENYKPFYPIVSKKWNSFGLKVFYIEIVQETESDVFDNEFGLIKKIDADKIDVEVPLPFSRVLSKTAFLSQISRLYAYRYLDNKNVLLSDVDMYPLNKDFFINNVKNIDNTKIVSYTQKCPHYPICYILANSEIMKDVLAVKTISFSEFAKNLIPSGIYDEKYLEEKIEAWPRFSCDFINLNRSPRLNRIDRSNWSYREDCIDAHLLRPYHQHKKEIDDLVNRTQ
jgi:hypothetical protein